ncbi:phosphate acyltransferase [Alkalibacterium olivapovliticus]|uniref:Phosphate butyryltransferase n=1 Tax=Alkalibacterium olivapovliticus TaxID=99907 RepID=A0A2T0W8G0_9LACT|nr:phosphate acyltransferase [Alkalibacterium olivapovliticus]PRY82983.1 phosphate butyryltransferase [Alkalibacterium olivapovliticus]
MPTVAVAGGSREEILELARLSYEDYKNDVKFIVFDTEDNIDTDDVWEYRHFETEEEMVRETVKSVADDESDILLKGGIKTHTLLKEVLKKEHQLKTQDLLSHVALVNLPALDRQILLTDAGMNIEPTEDQLAQIIENALNVGLSIGLTHPKIAILSAAENINPKMASSVMAKNITERFKEQTDATVFGPLSLDLALSKVAVEHKRFKGPIEGDADILVVPGIDAGNALYKSFLLFGDATIGGTIVGTKVPIVLTSRSDKVRSKLYALKFALMQIEDK